MVKTSINPSSLLHYHTSKRIYKPHSYGIPNYTINPATAAAANTIVPGIYPKTEFEDDVWL